MGDPIIGVFAPAPLEISAFNDHDYSEAIPQAHYEPPAAVSATAHPCPRRAS
jgi:hypothetical protein